MFRDSKKPSVPPRNARRTTRRGLPAVVAAPAKSAAEEPSTSTKPTRRDLAAAIADAQTSARGQFSIASARSVQTNEVSGSIEVDMTAGPRRRRASGTVELEVLSATRRELTVRVRGQQVVLDRAHALALAELIATTFS